jgi:hypothetical protein
MNNSVCSVKENTMKRISVFSVVVLVVLAFVSAAWALPFPITDVRALGMGGAFVAAGEGIGAVQYNPALLGEDTTLEVVIPNLVARVEDQLGLADLIDDLNNLNLPADSTQAIAILNKLDQGGGIDIQASGTIGAAFSAFGIGAGVGYNTMILGNASPLNIDATVAGIADTSKNLLRYDATQFNQLILTGAKGFGNIIVGANLRQLDATVYTDEVSLFSDPDVGIGDVTEGVEQDETATAIDVGVLFGLVPMVDIGIMAKDINGPKLGSIEFEPRYRIGASVSLPMITLAADYDLSDKTVDGATEYQEWAIGAEFDVWAIALRAGMSNNTSLGGSPTLLHLGAGLGFLDIGVAYAEEGDYYMAGVNLALGF